MTDTGMELPPRVEPGRDEPSWRRAVGSIPPWLIIIAVLGSAGLVGRLLADGKTKYGIALVIVACFAPLVFFDLTRALAVWVAVLFFGNLAVLSSGPNGIGVLVGLGWIGSFLGRRDRMLLVTQHRRLLLTIAALCLWFTLTITWSANAADAANEAAYWWLAALAFLVVLTTLRSARDVGIVALAFVAGSVVSVMIGLATGSLNPNSVSAGRLTGGGGDPNQQAAAFVAAMFLIIGLFSVYRGRKARLALLLSFVLMSIGFFATQSRGGLIALAVAAIAALVLAPRQRSRIVGLIVLVAIAGGILLATTPGALTRITDLGGGTSGRSDLWRVAWDVFTGHPVVGVGGGNFVVVESHYVLRPGSISRIQYLTAVPHVAHNTYLQLLAETGVVGLVGFLAVVLLSLRAGQLASRRFEAMGRIDYADLTRAIMMGTIGMLAALFFITDGDDQRLWVLLALGPVMLGIAHRAAQEREPG
jgi:O-antigen ligase